ncbi:MAG: CHAT domain-containing protein [Desulfomonilaceae bacterium]
MDWRRRRVRRSKGADQAIEGFLARKALSLRRFCETHVGRNAMHSFNPMKCSLKVLPVLLTIHVFFACSPIDFAEVWAQQPQRGQGEIGPVHLSMKREGDGAKKYHWLFKERKSEEPKETERYTGLFDSLDKEIKEARRLYLSGDLENAVLKYRSAIDGFEAILDDIPQGSSLLMELEQRLKIFDELAVKMLGPVQNEIPEEASSKIFHIMEKRRLVQRIMVLKKLPRLDFFDVPGRLMDQEGRVLQALLETRLAAPSQENTQREDSLKSQLAEVRQAIQKASERYTLLRAGLPISLAELRNDLLGPKEALLDINMLPDRVLVGVLTKEHARYYQFAGTRTDIDKVVFQLQDKLREFSQGERTTFMGHAWKEPCRRLYRSLIGPLPSLPQDKTTIFVIPDRSLWYLPFSALLDAEDRPLGQGRVISLIPSGDILKLLRITPGKKATKTKAEPSLLLFESIPWIPEEEVQERKTGSQKVDKSRDVNLSEEERLERLILTNPVYPKPSDIVITVQKLFPKFEVWVGPTATLDHFLHRGEGREDVTLLALPLSVWDKVSAERQPMCFFSPDKRGQRTLPVQQLFAHSMPSRLMVFPVAWFNVPERDTPSGEGPLLLNLALFYAGVKLSFCNYSDPNWGSDEPFLIHFLKKVAGHAPIGETLAQFPREMPAGLDSSFTGKPPSWTGWILAGDVNVP